MEERKNIEPIANNNNLQNVVPAPPAAPLFNQHLEQLFKVIETICRAKMGTDLKG